MLMGDINCHQDYIKIQTIRSLEFTELSNIHFRM